MKIVFYLFFLFQISRCRVEEGTCPKSIKEIPQDRWNLIGDPQSGTCLPPLPSGSVNWWGVASAFFSMIPEVGPSFSVFFGIIANSGISSDSEGYGDNFNECIKGMIRREIENTQLLEAKDILEQIGGESRIFMKNIMGDVDEDLIGESILDTIQNTQLKVDGLENLFSSDKDGFMQFKFIQLLLDGLTVETLLRVAFLSRLEELEYNHKDYCRHINTMRDRLEFRYDHFFKTDRLHNKLYASKFSEWPDNVVYKSTLCDYYQTQCYGDRKEEVRDKYTDNTTYTCKSDCYSTPIVSCRTDCSSSPRIDACHKAQDFVHETMTNIDRYLSNSKKTQKFALDFIKNMGHDINCHIDLMTTSTPYPTHPSPTRPTRLTAPTLDECVKAMGGFHDYFTSVQSLAEQSEIFKLTICPEDGDPGACEEHFNKFYASLAGPCLHDSFFAEPEDLCERIFSSHIEIQSREWNCDWCTYYMEAFAYLWTQQEALEHGLSVLHGECFCGSDGMDEDYGNCDEEVDKFYRQCLYIGGSVLLEEKTEICQDVLGVC